MAQALISDIGDAAPTVLQQIAKFQCKKNSFPDVSRKLRNWRGLNLDLMEMDLPMKVKKTVVWMKWPCIPPHHFANSCWRGSRAFFEKVFATKQGSYVPFWTALGKTEFGQALPAVQCVDSQDWRIASRIHGDGFQPGL